VPDRRAAGRRARRHVIARTSRAEIRHLVEARVPGMTAHDRDEMAIPSYLHWNPLIRWLMWRRYEVVAELAELAPGQHVLEFGCGLGLFLPTLAARVGRVYAVDRFPEFAKALAASRGLPVMFVDSVAAVADTTLDTIVAADVMEHLESPREWAVLFRRKLVSGGRLIVSGPTETPIYQLGRIAAGFAGKGDYHHTDVARLCDDITAVGFRLVAGRGLPFAVPPHLFKVLAFTHSV
jgi:2-polyprenyl-3-methyl-5-hydroxy-6-metoxy-1,4-benzoquinol methylase